MATEKASLENVLDGSFKSHQCDHVLETFYKCVGGKSKEKWIDYVEMKNEDSWKCKKELDRLNACLKKHPASTKWTAAATEWKERLVVDPDEVPRKKTGLGWGLHKVAPQVFNDEETGVPEKSKYGETIAKVSPRLLDTDNVERSNTPLKRFLGRFRIFKEDEE